MQIAVSLDIPRPVVADGDIDLCPELQKLAHVDLTDMVETPDIVETEWEALEMGLLVVRALPYSANAGDAERAEADDVRGTEIIDIRRGPPAVVEFPEMRCRLVIATHEDG